MAILTEETVRRLIKTTEIQETKVVEVEKGTIITPSARSFLSDHQIKLQEIPSCETNREDNQKNKAEVTGNQEVKIVQNPFLYKTLDGGQFVEKPVHMSVLKGNIIVPNDHPEIKLRGQLDMLHGEVLKVQLLASEAGFSDLIEELELIARCSQFMQESRLPSKLAYPSETEVVTFSIDYQMGALVIALNQLRLMIEQTSLMAYESLKEADGTIKEVELLEVLTKLARFCWKLMDNVNKGKYKKR